MQIMIDMINTMINIITYVLVAFTAISLVVSSIMIAIITYVSVIERTKEIGVLRAIGTRKRDISRVFNAETFIIGLAAGLFGVIVTYILNIPINKIISSLVDQGIGNIASLNPIHALILIAISIVLTLISGFIPSKIAAKKDPVIALRTE
jgi:putative ABC transport system permease protein